MKTSIASLFGLTQREMAMALGIGLSQWSMYEGGKRRLPLRAQLLLNDMLAHIQSRETARRKTKDVKQTDPRHVAHLQSLLTANAHEQARLAKKVDTLDRKQHAADRYTGFKDFAARRKADKAASESPMFVLRRTESHRLTPAARDLKFEAALKLELLIGEQQFLEQKLAAIADKTAQSDQSGLVR